MTDFANVIRSIRVANNLSQKEFAEAINASQTAVSYWESGRRQPRTDQLKRIAAVFNIDPWELPSSADLNENVQALIAICNSISAEGQEKVLDYARMVSQIPEYKKDCTP